MMFLSTILAAVGSSVITCAVMEAYYQRRATDAIGDYDKGME
jgi:hypothetical protein